jgi:hypothetical protein
MLKFGLPKLHAMSKNLKFSGHFEDGGSRITCKLPVIIFKEDRVNIAYCPALDLSGYGATEREARASFETVLAEYFTYTTRKKTLDQDLAKLGWNIKKSLKKGATPPSMVHLLQHNEDFSRIFNNHEYKKIDRTVEIPCCA